VAPFVVDREQSIIYWLCCGNIPRLNLSSFSTHVILTIYFASLDPTALLWNLKSLVNKTILLETALLESSSLSVQANPSYDTLSFGW